MEIELYEKVHQVLPAISGWLSCPLLLSPRAPRSLFAFEWIKKGLTFQFWRLSYAKAVCPLKLNKRTRKSRSNIRRTISGRINGTQMESTEINYSLQLDFRWLHSSPLWQLALRLLKSVNIMPSLTKVYLGRPAAVIATVVMKTLETESGYGCSRSDRCSADRNLIGGPPLSVNEWDWFRVTVFCLLARVIPFFFFFFRKKFTMSGV